MSINSERRFRKVRNKTNKTKQKDGGKSHHTLRGRRRVHRKVDSDVVRVGVDRFVAVKRIPPTRGWWRLVLVSNSSNALFLDSVAKTRSECVDHPRAVWRDDRLGVVGPRRDGNALANKRSCGCVTHRRHHLFVCLFVRSRFGRVWSARLSINCLINTLRVTFLLSCGEWHSCRIGWLTDCGSTVGLAGNCAHSGARPTLSCRSTAPLRLQTDL